VMHVSIETSRAIGSPPQYILCISFGCGEMAGGISCR
jgi:hypothetical protein